MITNDYAQPDVLVDTAWVAANLTNPKVRLVEVDVDINAYAHGHIPGAVNWDWRYDTTDPVRRSLPSPDDFEALMSRSGISNDTVVVLYGDKNNWFATFAFWLLKYYNHQDVLLINGGRKKWLAEGRPITDVVPQIKTTHYTVSTPNPHIRAMRDQVLLSVGRSDVAFIDVRSPKEFAGELATPDYLPHEGAMRNGHIPGAVNISWGQNVQRDGTFRSAAELRRLYGDENDVTPDKQVISYCRIGERSSHTWFVLTYLLGYPNVRNYDGSWAEYGNLIDAPIER